MMLSFTDDGYCSAASAALESAFDSSLWTLSLMLLPEAATAAPAYPAARKAPMID